MEGNCPGDRAGATKRRKWNRLERRLRRNDDIVDKHAVQRTLQGYTGKEIWRKMCGHQNRF